MSTLAVFSFENSQVRTTGSVETPLFVAIDVAAALGYQRARDAVTQHCDPDDIIKAEIETKGGRQTVNCVNESGLYALIFGSKLESAKRFKRWVTNEVLPAIRKQGHYECPIATITPSQQLQLREEVARRAKAVSAHYQTVYRALYARFQVPRYTEILAKDFGAAIDFIRTVDLRTPVVRDEEPAHEMLPTAKAQVLASVEFCEHVRTLVYCWRYLFKKEIDLVYQTMRAMKSPHAPMLWEAIHDLNLIFLEKDLEKVGFPVKELKCYQYWAAHNNAE
ncbi:MAG TPA: ORF6C domain-containing protein [Candidatus Duodenibacillus intestinavium]|nr:ORF6C domain-containing protein [Candidatus Duodenibacillus intestinavium]